MVSSEEEKYLARIEDLQNRLDDAEQLIEAIKAGEVDAFAMTSENNPQVFTRESSDYAYRVLIESCCEGAINITNDGLVVYCNKYFHELLGLSYERVVGTSIRDFLPPDSLIIFDELVKKAMIGPSKGEVVFSTGDKTVSVYISLTSLLPNLPTIGIIVTDLTEKNINEKILADKNKELERSNEELASFSYIASHDLQEPLRKIQIFSTRILVNQDKNLEPDSKDYFQRIIKATQRMQSLIGGLLDYSRNDGATVVPVLTDLNILLIEVQKELADILAQNDASITIDNLPALRIIPDQFTQLFTNIILNAVKYCKKEIRLAIKISAALISSTDEDQLPIGAKGNYWKIIIEDNGIGFSSEYNEQIFGLFKRLHGNDEYQGTGIGLAICKKIMQNHHGFLSAKGEPGIGATFMIYMPESQS
ncbi:MAG: ATP-binding protein [Sediminibacterium sp.]